MRRTRLMMMLLACLLPLLAACAGGTTTSGSSAPAASTGASTPAASGAAASTASSGGTAATYPTEAINILAPAAPGGGWDQTARAMQTALAASTGQNVQVYNVAGAGGTVGLAQFVNEHKGDPHQLMVAGLVMVGAIQTNKSPVTLDQVTPIATITTEYEGIVVPANSPYQTFQDLIDAFKANPSEISWGGGSAGGTDHILVGLLAKAAGADPKQINYVAHSGGGEALAAILSGSVTAGVSGVSEFREQVAAGNLRWLAVSGDERIEGIDAPTIKEAGLDVVLPNWRAVWAPADISAEQRAGIVAAIDKMQSTPEWQQALEQNGWTNYFQGGDEYSQFLDAERTRVEGVLRDIGLVQ